MAFISSNTDECLLSRTYIPACDPLCSSPPPRRRRSRRDRITHVFRVRIPEDARRLFVIHKRIVSAVRYRNNVVTKLIKTRLHYAVHANTSRGYSRSTRVRWYIIMMSRSRGDENGAVRPTRPSEVGRDPRGRGRRQDETTYGVEKKKKKKNVTSYRNERATAARRCLRLCADNAFTRRTEYHEVRIKTLSGRSTRGAS